MSWASLNLQEHTFTISLFRTLSSGTHTRVRDCICPKMEQTQGHPASCQLASSLFGAT